jgi:hypothetical protein
MFDYSVSQFVGILAAGANIAIALMIILLLGERSHAAWVRMRVRADELTALKAEVEHNVAESQRVVQQMQDDIGDSKNKLLRAEQDIEALVKRHRETDLPVSYTSTLVDVVDRRYRTWRVVVRNPDMGAAAGSFSHPAHRWVEGRFYEVPAPNMDYAVATMQSRFLLRDGFTVDPAPHRQTVMTVDAVEAI